MLEPPSASASSAVASSAVASSAAASGMSNFGLIFPDVVTRSLFNFKLIRNIGQLPEKKRQNFTEVLVLHRRDVPRFTRDLLAQKRLGVALPR